MLLSFIEQLLRNDQQQVLFDEGWETKIIVFSMTGKLKFTNKPKIKVYSLDRKMIKANQKRSSRENSKR